MNPPWNDMVPVLIDVKVVGPEMVTKLPMTRAVLADVRTVPPRIVSIPVPSGPLVTAARLPAEFPAMSRVPLVSVTPPVNSPVVEEAKLTVGPLMLKPPAPVVVAPPTTTLVAEPARLRVEEER